MRCFQLQREPALISSRRRGRAWQAWRFPAATILRNSRLFSGPNNLNRIPNIDLKGSTGTQFEISSWPWRNKADDYQIRDDLSWTRGAHQLRFGFSWALYKKVQDLFGQTQGGFNFDGTFTGNDFADFLLGYSKSYQELAVQDHGLWNNVSWASYVQDNWRVSRRLTLNLGLRWDGVPHTYEANDRMGNFYPELYDPVKAASMNPDGTIKSTSLGLGFSPNPILAGVPLYLMASVFRARTVYQRVWLTITGGRLARVSDSAYDPQPVGERTVCSRRFWHDVRADSGQRHVRCRSEHSVQFTGQYARAC